LIERTPSPSSAGSASARVSHAAPIDVSHGAGNEVIMHGEVETAGWIVGPNSAIAEGRISDRELVALGQPGLGEILMPDPGVGIEEFCNARRGGVRLDAGKTCLIGELFRHKGEEEA
jgi:hypothetical protein